MPPCFLLFLEVPSRTSSRCSSASLFRSLNPFPTIHLVSLHSKAQTASLYAFNPRSSFLPLPNPSLCLLMSCLCPLSKYRPLSSKGQGPAFTLLIAESWKSCAGLAGAVCITKYENNLQCKNLSVHKPVIMQTDAIYNYVKLLYKRISKRLKSKLHIFFGWLGNQGTAPTQTTVRSMTAMAGSQMITPRSNTAVAKVHTIIIRIIVLLQHEEQSGNWTFHS